MRGSVVLAGLTEHVVELDELEQVSLRIAERRDRPESFVVRLDQNLGPERTALGHVLVEADFATDFGAGQAGIRAPQ